MDILMYMHKNGQKDCKVVKVHVHLCYVIFFIWNFRGHFLVYTTYLAVVGLLVVNDLVCVMF